MKKSVLAAVFAVLLFAPLCAFDWGGKLNNTTKYQGNKFDSFFWYESAGAHLWFTSPIGSKLYFGTDASYEFRYDQKGGTAKHIVDINLFKLGGTFHPKQKDTFEFGAGRFSVNDATGIIFNQTSDGIYAKYSWPVCAVTLYGGTTRLLNSHDVVILRRFSDTTVKFEDASFVYVLGPSYIPLGLSLYFPSVFLNQDITLEQWGFIDYSGDGYNRFYTTLMFSGPVLNNLFYAASTTFSTVNTASFSNLSKLTLSFYPVEKASVGFSGVYASGGHGAISPFRGFTSQTAVLASETAGFNTEYESKLKAEISGAYTFLSRVYVGASAAVVFACPDAFSYNGFQWRIDAIWNIFHDLQLSSAIYQYIGKNGGNDKLSLSVSGAFIF